MSFTCWFKRCFQHALQCQQPARCFGDAVCVRRALVVSKLSRYEFEKQRHSEKDEVQLEVALRKRGSDYDMLLRHHRLHKDFEQSVVANLRDCGVESRVVNRFNYDESAIDWCDVVMPVGGDGTFLLAASRVSNNEKPVIGLNSDPNRSEGHLCLPKQYSRDVKSVVEKLQKGAFEWRFRSRIRVTLCGDRIHEPPVQLHEQELFEPERKFSDCVEDNRRRGDGLTAQLTNTRVLPTLALNEVFIGECLSARVSYMELRLDGGERTKVKSSGLLISTGTGSTSWHLSINRLSEQAVAELLAAAAVDDPRAVAHATRAFNDSLTFALDDKRMGYTVRDLISAGVWPSPKGLAARGFADHIEVRSRCFNAGLVIDGGVSYNFNDGTIAIFDVNDRDALRTVRLHD